MRVIEKDTRLQELKKEYSGVSGTCLASIEAWQETNPGQSITAATDIDTIKRKLIFSVGNVE